MTQTDHPLELDPFEAYLRRDPLSTAGIDALVLEEGADHTEATEAIAEGLRELLKDQADRPAAEVRIVNVGDEPLHVILTKALAQTSRPLVLITTARVPWTLPHLEPLLKAIDQCDHVVGGRPAGDGRGARSWLGRLVRRILFGIPVRDAYSPCKLHRREKLIAILLQSSSSFIDVEILAKATFLGHLIDEVDVPPLPHWARWKGWWSDLNLVFRNPTFRSPLDDPRQNEHSGPAEPTEGQHEGHEGPGPEDGQGQGDIEQPRPFENDAPERLDQLS